MIRKLNRVPGVILVATAAAMWGTDPILRKPLGHDTTATTIVFGEHVVLVVLTLPLLVPALRAVVKAGPRYLLAARSEEHTSELQSHHDLGCRLLLEKKSGYRLSQ